MKKSFLIVFFIILLLLASCSKENKGIVIEKTENLLNDTPTAPVGYEYLKGVGSWLSAETEYKSSPYDNIVSIKGNNFSITNDNIYFKLKKEESKRDETGYYYTLGHPIYAYISGQTGEKQFLCPDPLCTHGAYSDCQYLDLGNLTFSTSDISLMYATRSAVDDGVFYPTLYEINTSAATITPIYKPDDKSEGLDMVYLNLMFEKDGKLYFIYNSKYEYVNDSGETEHDEKAKLMYLDLKAKKTEVLNEDLSTRVGLIGEVWDKLLFGDGNTLELYFTDYNFENPVTIMKFDGGYGLQNLFYDGNTDELYMLSYYGELMYPRNPDMSGKDIHCKVYKIDNEFNIIEIPMPSEMITSIQLTKDYIYYTVYDPIQYGTRKGHPILDTTGGKLYRAPRDNTTEVELFFDAKGELIFKGAYCVVGENLYLQYYKLRGVADDTSFYYTGSIARVNIKENTLKWINLY